MTGMVVLALDRDVAGHVCIALRRHRNALGKAGLAEPDALAQLEELAREIVSSGQQASASVTVQGLADDALHDREFLTRSDVHRITGASLSTVDRWVRSGSLRSCRHGRTRRIARADLDRFLATA